MKDLFAYLFGDSQMESEVEETKAMIEKIMEEADDQEPLKIKRTPLLAALKALGLKDVRDEVQYDPEGFSLVCKEESDYREYVRLLMEPDAMEELAKLGWVMARCGDVAMSNEPAEFRIRFLEITTVDTNSKDEWPTGNQKLITGVIKKGREFMDKPGPHDEESPVEFDDKTSDDHAKGVGKEQDGKEPEGKPKGSTGKTESAEDTLAANEKRLQVMSRRHASMDKRSAAQGYAPAAKGKVQWPGVNPDTGRYYTDKGGKPKSAPADEAEPPRYDDMYRMLSEHKQKAQKVKKAYKIKHK